MHCPATTTPITMPNAVTFDKKYAVSTFAGAARRLANASALIKASNTRTMVACFQERDELLFMPVAFVISEDRHLTLPLITAGIKVVG